MIFNNYALIGAYGENDNGDYSGSAYVFVCEDNEWIEQAKLTADDADGNDHFGYSVSISGEYAIFGAYGNDDDGGNSGSAYIFARNNEEWAQQVKLTASDAAADDLFGWSVSICGDFVLVGADYNSDNGNASGSAYIFYRDENDWSQHAKLTADDAAHQDYFGSSVSVSGEYTIVGAHGNDDGGEGSGSAYIYSISYPNHPEIAVSTDIINFPNVRPGEASEQTLIISNIGNAELRVEGVSIEGDYFSTDFEIEIVIQPDEEFELLVTFSPEERGDFEGILTITSNDPLHEETSVSLSGTGGGIAVPLRENWNLISINVSPPQEFYEENDNRGPDVILMMEHLRIDENNHHILLMKNEDGRFYLPAFGFNNIPYWDLTRGYQVKADADVEADFSGEPIPADADIWLDEGWNIIAYFPTYQLDARSPDYYVLSSVIDVVEMAKNVDGLFLAPRFHFSNMPPWRETQGYQVKVSEDVLLNYPAMQGEFQLNRQAGTPDDTRNSQVALAVNPDALADAPVCQSGRYATSTRTGENMSLLVNSISGCDLSAGSQIAAVSAGGVVVGSGTVDADGRCGLAIWGDDPGTDLIEGLKAGESFTLKVWDAKQNREMQLSTITTLEGAGLIYEPDGMTVLEMATETAVPEDFFLSEAYPNPFNAFVRLSYGLPDAADAAISVYDLNGRLVTTLVSGKLNAGYHTVVWDGNATASGIYFVQMSAGEFKSVRKVTLVK